MTAITEESICTCDPTRVEPPPAAFVVAPAAGGGWPAWTAALSRLVAGILDRSSHALVLTQEPNQRYAQLLVGHGRAHVEAASNQYLTGDFRLGPSEEAVLTSLGYRPAEDLDSVRGLPSNWWLDVAPADPLGVAELLMVTVVTVAGFDAAWPVTVSVFELEHPCAACTWGST